MVSVFSCSIYFIYVELAFFLAFQAAQVPVERFIRIDEKDEKRIGKENIKPDGKYGYTEIHIFIRMIKRKAIPCE